MMRKLMKRMVVSSILLLAVVALSGPAWAASASCYVYTADEDFVGYYIDGSLKLSITFTDYVSATITLPKLANVMDLAGEYGYGEYFYFFSDGGVGDNLLYLVDPDLFYYIGDWRQSGCNIYMDFSYLADYLVAALGEMGVDAGLGGPVTTTAKISSKDQTNSGKTTIKIYIYSPLEGNLSVTLSFKGYPLEFSLDRKTTKSLMKGKSSVSPELKSFLSSVFSKLPKKGADPGLLPSHQK
jgi:hypothetical protein